MDYLLFSLGFFVIHTGAYFVAGVIARSFSDDVYAGDRALLGPILRDTARKEEAGRIMLLLLPSQLLRALLMSVVLYPILDPLADLSLGLRIAFLAGLMFVYADFASAIPFPNTIEGAVYLKREFIKAGAFLKIQSEAVIYSLLFGVVAAWLLF